ncbi:DNA topoisomerase I, partial [Lactobacillus paracasei]|uniref:toprim domain-containing protein n=1 Tax=Lacticaseibacillus paracasei TaxID=1597 RepID=UPI0013C7CCEF
GEMGFDEETLEIDYELSGRGEGFVRKTKANLKKFDAVCLASDPDREGEAIAKSLKKHLGLGEGDYFRCTFNSITKSQLANALSNPRKIDYS